MTDCCENCDYRQWVDGEMDVSCRNSKCPCHTPTPKEGWVEEFYKFWELQFPNSHPAEYGVTKKFIAQLLASQNQKLVERVEKLSSCLEEAIDLMEDVREGKYKPDSFTTQPWRKAIDDILKLIKEEN